jgi:hypothetical protein
MKGISGPPIPTAEAGAFTRNLGPLVERVRTLVLSARRAAASSVNTLQVLTNFEIGRLIVEHEQQGASRAEYGAQLLKELSERLTPEFGKCFSRSNLQNMRNFFLLYQCRLQHIAQMPSGKLPGIILCKKKHDALVEITLPKEANVFASAYQLYLPSKEDLRQQLLQWTYTENSQ